MGLYVHDDTFDSPGTHLARYARSQPQGVLDQVAALRAEGVEVTRSALGELVVDFGVYGWFPGMLPSEAQEGESVGVGVGVGEAEAEAEGVDEGEDVAA